ncbi:SRPBCC family protein [Noviluteimonas gilva]|uniref:SRPBCC family protein n=1 Tax=Noviluteimonas gilva TaxID=2682097 RepID=A0A7C9HYJ4_9GAMM|nr:SRPBCC family protein [Lysobacter gilvus]MUV14154.1 SRPBCC family protein [Lysobacter gilvus]
MASIRREVLVEARPQHAWAAARDVGNIHTRLVPGFVTDCRLEGDVRIVTFGNGLVVREPILDINDDDRRVAWAAEGGQFKHYNASVQVFDEGAERTRIVWIADLLPNELAPTVGDMIEQGLAVMKQTLERSAG